MKAEDGTGGRSRIVIYDLIRRCGNVTPPISFNELQAAFAACFLLYFTEISRHSTALILSSLHDRILFHLSECVPDWRDKQTEHH